MPLLLHLPQAGAPKSHLRFALMHATHDFRRGGAILVELLSEAVDRERAEKDRIVALREILQLV
jgi:hypothetical protein